jgi:sarcosine oxidase gamma subunit
VAAENENRVLAAIFRGLVWVEEKIFWRVMAHRVRLLPGELAHGPLVVEVYPTDVVIRARRPDATYAFAVLADTLDHRDVYFSWDADAQAFEDRLGEARRAAAGGNPPGDEQLAALAEELRTLGLGPEEWSALRRQLHRAEADALRARLGDRDADVDQPA